MAGRAGGRETGRDVIGIIGLLIFRLVAPVTVGGQSCVVVVHMAICALDAYVLSRQRECRIVVIECRGRPACGAVAHIALLRETNRNMVRVVGLLEVGQMATDACRIGDVVVVIDVTLTALNGGMSASQRPSRCGVIKALRAPGCG